MRLHWRAVLLLGAWLCISPTFISDASVAADTNARIVGVAIVLCGMLAFVQSSNSETWLDLILGVWLILAPFVIGFTHAPASTWNALGVGAVVVIGALLTILHGGQRNRHDVERRHG